MMIVWYDIMAFNLIVDLLKVEEQTSLGVRGIFEYIHLLKIEKQTTLGVRGIFE